MFRSLVARRVARMEERERLICRAISMLRPEFASGFAISRLACLGVGTVYPVLARLEARGTITSRWVEGQQPRRRVYALATSGAAR